MVRAMKWEEKRREDNRCEQQRKNQTPQGGHSPSEPLVFELATSMNKRGDQRSKHAGTYCSNAKQTSQTEKKRKKGRCNKYSVVWFS